MRLTTVERPQSSAIAAAVGVSETGLASSSRHRARCSAYSDLRRRPDDRPAGAVAARTSPAGATAGPRRGSNLLWAQLMQRSFGFEVLACPRCGGRLRLIALIEDSRVIQRILHHLRLPAEVSAARAQRGATPSVCRRPRRGRPRQPVTHADRCAVSGRLFDERDSEAAQPVAIIDETMERTFWPDEDPIGRRIERGGRQSTQPWLTIVGVVRHVRYRTLEEPSRVQLYVTHAQVPTTGMSLRSRPVWIHGRSRHTSSGHRARCSVRRRGPRKP